MKDARKESKDNLDPLYVIFEKHLLSNFQDTSGDPNEMSSKKNPVQNSDQGSGIDQKTFIKNIVQEYLTYLRHLKITVPKPLEGPIIEELTLQVNTMLIKKVYGFLNIQEYRKEVTPSQRRKARERYIKMNKKISPR